jgi:hypothetical protein
MPTTSRPASARRPATYSPPGPSPTTITSASVTIVDPFPVESYRSQRTALWTDSLRRSRTSFLKPPAFGAVDAIAGRQASLEDHHRRGWLGQDSPWSSIRTAGGAPPRRGACRGCGVGDVTEVAVRGVGRAVGGGVSGCAARPPVQRVSRQRPGGVVLRVVRPFRCVQSFRGISHDLAGQHGADPARRTPRGDRGARSSLDSHPRRSPLPGPAARWLAGPVSPPGWSFR